jgi:hypothetical protein
MKKKIFAVSCMMIFILITAIPCINAEEEIESTTSLFNSMRLAHIKIDGTGSSFTLANEFILGFGSSGFMRFNLDEGSHIEINKILDPSDILILDGSHVITIFGFIGYYRESEMGINLNGFTTLVIWR